MPYFQPQNAYKFSTDALLLSEFACSGLERALLAKKRGVKAPFYLLDLGCACGVVGLEILRFLHKTSARAQDFYILGLDNKKELVRAANLNATTFGLEKQYQAVCLDIEGNFQKEMRIICHNLQMQSMNISSGMETDTKNRELQNPRLFDAVITNPPWYHEDSGIITQNPLRQNALFGKKSMGIFLSFADKYLKEKASLFMIGKPAYFAYAMREMPQTLSLQYLQNVYTRGEEKNATFFMLEAKRHGKGDCVFLPSKHIPH